MSNENGRQILEEAKAMEHGEVACGLAIAAEALSIELKRVKQQRAELLEVLKLIQSSGSYYMMHGVVVDAVNKAITKAEAAE